MIETSSMLIESAVLQLLLKHRHLGPERLVVKSSVPLICVFLSNGKDRFEHHVFYVADFGHKSSQSLDHFVRHSVPRAFLAGFDLSSLILTRADRNVVGGWHER